MITKRYYPRIALLLVAITLLAAVLLYIIAAWRKSDGNGDIEFIHGARTYRWVCIEETGGERGRQISVYGAHCNCSTTLNMRIRPERNYRRYHTRLWPLHFKTVPIPPTHVVKDTHAYFVPYSRYGNLHHFLHDSAENLYATMEIVGDYQHGRLQVPEFHILAHTWDLYAGEHGEHVDHLGPLKQTFQPIEQALGATYVDVYTSVPANTCYALGVFGFDTSQLKPLAFENALRQRWDMTPDKCSPDKRPQVLIIQRRLRRIGNMEQILEAFKRSPMLNASIVIVDFEDLSLAEQVKVVSCSDVLIGIHGAGIDHHRFLKPHGGFIVISFNPFPSDYYLADARFKEQGYDTIKNCPVRITDEVWTWYRAHVSNATKEEVYAFSANMKHHIPENIWHYAVCDVNVAELLQKTSKLLLNMAEQSSPTHVQG